MGKNNIIVDQESIKYIVGSKMYLRKLKRLMRRIDRERFMYCDDRKGTLRRGAYDMLFDAGLWEASKVRQEYANILCHTSKLTSRQRNYVVLICNRVYYNTSKIKRIGLMMKKLVKNSKSGK